MIGFLYRAGAAFKPRVAKLAGLILSPILRESCWSVDLLIALPSVFFLIWLCLHANIRSRITISTCTHTYVMLVIGVLMVVYFTKRGRIG